jgi:putative nucleotidyltransferase with HDIG domain
METTRDNALEILHEYVESPALIRHCVAVEASMREYARKFGEDEARWGFVGLVHDFDFEIHPTLDQHPQDGAPILRSKGVPEDVVQDVLSHAEHTDTPRDTSLRKTLAAVDELSSFVVAVALVRPSKSLDDVKPSSVKKKMKDKAFARAVDRDEMRRAAQELGVDFDEHILTVIEGLKPVADQLGLVAGEGVEAGD